MDRILQGQRVAIKVAAWLIIVNATATLLGAGLMVILYGR